MNKDSIERIIDYSTGMHRELGVVTKQEVQMQMHQELGIDVAMSDIDIAWEFMDITKAQYKDIYVYDHVEELELRHCRFGGVTYGEFEYGSTLVEYKDEEFCLYFPG